MRTTLDIEDDVLLAAKELAQQRRRSVGGVISDLARQALTPKSAVEERNGIPLFPRRPDSGLVTTELVNELRDEAP